MLEFGASGLLKESRQAGIFIACCTNAPIAVREVPARYGVALLAGAPEPAPDVVRCLLAPP